MLVKKNPNVTLWESILPPGFDKLPPELERVDALLDDDAFFAPYAKHFSAFFGRPSIPIETYLRMMWLKFRYGLGYETLVKEVGDSISWSRFCHISLGQSPPHPTTLLKITKRCGSETIAALNAALLEKAAQNKVLRTDKVRADTTVVEANVNRPTRDSWSSSSACSPPWWPWSIAPVWRRGHRCATVAGPRAAEPVRSRRI